MHINLEDPYLVDKIVSEVKSQGIFDQFRKDCMSDVDTKPAYQNLRQRVEISVGKFLSEQVWSPDTNKIQLREKLRKHITESGFLETGVERIVDQVVNPKITSTYQSQIEDIAYKYLGIEKPENIEMAEETTSSYTNGNLACEVDLMPTDLELEAVSPDSDKTTNKSNGGKSDMNDSDDKNEDEEESPPFEPLEGRPPSPEDEDSNESKLSAISGLTSQDSVKSDAKSFSFKPTEECQLSQVSSSSHLSILSNDGEEFGIISKQPGNDISEEAQMPKFFENTDKSESKSLHFDINKDEIKFEGTERGSAIHSLSVKNRMDLEIDATETNQSERTSQNSYSEFPDSSTGDNDNDSDKQLKIITDVSQSDSIALSLTEKIESGNEKEQQKGSTDNEANKNKLRHHDNDTKSSSRSSSKEHRSSRKDRHRSNSHKNKSENSSKSEKSSGNEKDNDSIKLKRTKEKSEKINDDHFSSKQKITRRKSTDSNDDDDAADEYKHSRTLGNTTKTLTESTNNSKLSDIESCSNSDMGTSAQSSNERKSSSFRCDKMQRNLKPVILDEFFNNSRAHAVEFAIGVNHKIHSEKIEETHENADEHKGFEWHSGEKDEFEMKLEKLLTTTENKEYRLYICCNDEGFTPTFKQFSMHVEEIKNNSNNDASISSKQKFHRNFTGFPPENELHRLVEGKHKRKHNCQAFVENKRKRFLDYSSMFPNIISNDQVNMKLCSVKLKSISSKCNAPATENSALCFGSKENNEKANRHITANDKIMMKNNQRYSSEDLYKPRLTLCQRSRRRGVDTCDY